MRYLGTSGDAMRLASAMFPLRKALLSALTSQQRSKLKMPAKHEGSCAAPQQFSGV